MWKTLNLIPDCSTSLDFSFAQIVSRLQVQPKLEGGVQANGKPERYIGADAAALKHNVIHRWGGYIQRPGQSRCRKTQRFKVFLQNALHHDDKVLRR